MESTRESSAAKDCLTSGSGQFHNVFDYLLVPTHVPVSVAALVDF